MAKWTGMSSPSAPGYPAFSQMRQKGTTTMAVYTRLLESAANLLSPLL